MLRYVVGTTYITLKYYKFPLFVLSWLLDFDYGGDRDDIKLTFSYIFSISSGAIS